MSDFTDNTGGSFATFRKLAAKLSSGALPADSAAAGLDFLPGGYAQRRHRRRTDAIMLSLLVIVVGVVATTWHISERALATAQAAFDDVDSRYTEAARRIDQVKQMRQTQKTVADRMELTASLLERMPRSNVLAELTNALPHGVSLTDCQLEARRKTAPPPPPGTKGPIAIVPIPLAYDTEVFLEGVAYTEGQVSDYINALGESGYFASVDLRWVKKGASAGGKKDADAEMRTFMVAVMIDPMVEAREHEARLTPRPAPLASVAD